MSKSKERQATVRIEVRCLKADADKIKAKAEAAGISTSELMRNAALNRKIKIPTDVKLTSSLLQLGGLQKHLYTQMKAGMSEELSKQFADVLVAIKKAILAIDLSQSRIE
ncbi:ribbon-helix-helix protein, CopG family [Pseudomonas syringae pv. syringae]|uniref:plasmid mobilization protein MobA n=1 Tax=Pseudomonas syringae TaxID=317 RepID=UPI00200AA579|nr:plasmid mobilization protein MobA [Pseudomonas syringae]MCK9759898.1 ribbon-helix-helix protein, CopG family [Pseudomonas syringae pv. syringae]MCK9774889.1 ribbon-helix-helix protein, CopG family [Pseudomonas syringae pv. syringae]